jgi:hypothetical protein
LPVHTLQQAPALGPQSTWVQVDPAVNTWGDGQAAGPEAMKHMPVAGLQHAPPLGKHVRGVQLVAESTLPPAMAHTAGSSA